jgi:hypothetical protein
MKCEYHVCDRCGKKIKPLPEWWFRRLNLHSINLETKVVEPHVLISDYYDALNRIRDEELSELENNGMEIQVESYYTKDGRTIELCGDCRKDFEAFMNGTSQ